MGVSVKGNQGTAFLKPGEKPYLMATLDAPLRESSDESSAVARALVKGEVLELLEGPREKCPEPESRLHCIACKDGAEGWITLHSSGGSGASASSSFYVCKSTIAMTNVFDIKTCKVEKKVVVGETLQVISDQESQQDETRGVSRLRFRSVRDGKEGWVSLKGNQG